MLRHGVIRPDGRGTPISARGADGGDAHPFLPGAAAEERPALGAAPGLEDDWPEISVYKLVSWVPMSRAVLDDFTPATGWRKVKQDIRFALHRARRRWLWVLDFHWHDDRWLPHQHDYGRQGHHHGTDDRNDEDDW